LDDRTPATDNPGSGNVTDTEMLQLTGLGDDLAKAADGAKTNVPAGSASARTLNRKLGPMRQLTAN
jgi:hypothetical protein